MKNETRGELLAPVQHFYRRLYVGCIDAISILSSLSKINSSAPAAAASPLLLFLPVCVTMNGHMCRHIKTRLPSPPPPRIKASKSVSEASGDARCCACRGRRSRGTFGVRRAGQEAEMSAGGLWPEGHATAMAIDGVDTMCRRHAHSGRPHRQCF